MSQEKDNRVQEFPLLPLRGVIVFPYVVMHLDVGREKSIHALDQAMLEGRLILLVTQKDAKTDEPGPDDLYRIGTVAEIKQLIKIPGGAIKVLVEGLYRAKILDYLPAEGMFQVRAEVITDPEEKTLEIEALMRSVINQFEQYIKLSKKVPPETLVSVVSIEEGGRLADVIVSHLGLKVEDKQTVLESTGVQARLERVYLLLSQEIEILELERRIGIRVRKQMEKTQKEYFLREQLKAIQKELGEKDERDSEVDSLRQKISTLALPPEVEEKALKEVERLEKMPPMSAETVVVRNYLDWVLALPWTKQTEDRLDINYAEEILNADHYGLQKVKERILEYLSIRTLAQKLKGPILCLIGPPGVGKTSLAKSVARALGKNFVRISLGGVRDEAEIRGHRRTYVGALPGRVIQGMKQAGSKNPVFLMDEIDKMNADFRGDPASALLEVLDPEQNAGFSDHYIEIPFDLSKVMFITTANAMHNIPQPLLDRMEVIYLSGYTEEEKVQIGAKYLVPKQLTEHGLKPENLKFGEKVLRRIIREYTREAGVRNLEREIAAVCRKAARKIVQTKVPQVSLTARNLEMFLGIPRYHYAMAEKDNEVGVATGVAWTETGGDILFIEATLMKGKGALSLTGKLGEVMRESAQAGFSYIRAKAAELNIEESFQDKYDVHIHIPEGAIPKDGPSAGITMATAVVSALTNRRIRRDVAMTGEITLRGRVLPVGGIKEKVLAAHRGGIKTMILPRENRKDLEDIPANIQRKLHFVFVENMDQVLPVALSAPEPVAP